MTDLQSKQFTAKVTYQALTAQEKLQAKVEQQWQVALPQAPVWPVVWVFCHKGLNTGQESEVSYLITHRVTKTVAYLKFKCGMKSTSEFCGTCSQIEDLEHLFLTCKKTKLVWKYFTPIFKEILLGESQALLLWNFQTKDPKRPTTLDDSPQAVGIPMCLSFL